MASYTGQELYKLLQQQVGQAYSGYLDTFKADRIFKQAHIEAATQYYKNSPNQVSKDNLTTISNTNVVKVPFGNVLQTQALQIVGVTIGSATTFVITTYLPHLLTTGNAVTIAGVAGTLTMNTANGVFNATVIGPNTFVITVASATGVYAAGSGTVTTPFTITDYWHLIQIKCRYEQPIYNWTITDATNASPIVLTISSYNSFRTGDYIKITGITGNTNANGNYYIRKINSFKIALYTDKALQTPRSGNAAYISGGSISKIFYESAMNYVSEQKGSVITVPTTDLPAVEVANNLLRIYPLDSPCTEVTMDYLVKPVKLIVSTDNVLDMSVYYPENFLLYVVSISAEIFGKQIRDRELVANEAGEKQKDI